MLSPFPLSLLLSTLLLSPLALAAGDLAIRSNTDSDIDTYRRAHFYGHEHNFPTRDGWEEIAVSDLPSKYDDNPVTSSSVEKRSTSEHKKHKSGAPSRLDHHPDEPWNGMNSTGTHSEVLITWYSGHDLLNPSCWENSDWAPTDSSMVAALTLHGWKNKPKCKRFVELCNSLKKCIFVRIVDTCAGCAPGSAHVDLTKAAFRQLAPLVVGQTKVHMRLALGSPNKWYKELWGPE